jgi:hypothetical protein
MEELHDNGQYPEAESLFSSRVEGAEEPSGKAESEEESEE